MTDALPSAEGQGLARSPGALAGLKVIDLTRVLGGPYCTMILSDHGAEVIKLEPPQGDEVRDWGPPFDEHGDASYFIGVNRNKRSVGLDLSKPEGRQVLLRLLEGADVLVENFKPGSMEKWGLGYEQVLSGALPAADALPRLRLRRRRAAWRLPRLRRRDAGDGRADVDQRHGGQRPDAARQSDRRHRHRPLRRHRHPDGPAGAGAERAGASSAT